MSSCNYYKCPHCGKNNTVYILKEGKDYAVICDFSWGGCGACGGFRETPKEAAEAWNMRAGEVKECEK